MKKILLIIMSILSLYSLAMNLEKNSYDYDHEILKELEEILDRLDHIENTKELNNGVKLYIPKNNEVTAHILQKSHIKPASLSIQHDTIRNQVQGKLIGLYLVNEKLNQYQAFFAHAHYQMKFCTNGKCYERFAGDPTFKSADIKKAVQVLQPDQYAKVLALQQKLEEIKNPVRTPAQPNNQCSHANPLFASNAVVSDEDFDALCEIVIDIARRLAQKELL